MSFFLKHSKWIRIILIFGYFIRVYEVSSMPPSLNWDEVSHGYNAYSILKTGKDEWGVAFPTIFRAFGDYKLPVYVYATAISEFLLGLNAFAVRFPSVVAGTTSILFTYLLTKLVFKKEQIAIIAALVMAISPWSLFLSRIAVEANFAFALILAGVYFLTKGTMEKSRKILLGIILLSLSMWTYNSARIFVPLFVTSFAIIYRSDLLKLAKIKSLLFAVCLLIFALFTLPMFVQLLNPEGSARYESVQILDVGAIAEINDRRQNANLPPIVERAIYNKATFFVENFIPNYIRHFSPVFLFFSGGDNYQFNIPGYGLLYVVNLPILVYGAYKLIKKKRNREVAMLFSWLLLSPIAASMTRESPHTLRSIMMIAPFMIIIAHGFYELTLKVKYKYKTQVYVLIMLLSFFAYFRFYGTSYREAHSFAWQYGYKQMAGIIEENYDKYEKIVITKKYAEPHEFLLFYLKYDPEKYRNDPNLIRFEKSNWFWVDRFDKFYFVNEWDMPDTSSRFVLESGNEFDCASCLLFTTPFNAPEGWKKIDEIQFLNGEIAFDVYEH